MPIKKVLFLHITDTHVALMPGQSPNDIGNPSGSVKNHHQHFEERDSKVSLKATTRRTRLQVFRETISDIAEELKKQKRTLSGIIMSGDIGIYGISDGAAPYRDMLLEHFHGLGITTKNIVVTPGNHDIKSQTDPGSEDRYGEFIATWRQAGNKVVTPLLDGIDGLENGALVGALSDHVLTDENKQWVVVPINSANWSHTRLDVSDKLKTHLEDLKASDKEQLGIEIDRLLCIDAARVSTEQLEGVCRLLKSAPPHALRIAVLHHHLLPVSDIEEIKPFADMINLGLLRQFLRTHKFHVVIHGHKHRRAVFYDHIYDPDGNDEHAHRVLVISGGTLTSGASDAHDVCRLIELENLPYAPVCTVTSIPLHRVSRKSGNWVSIKKRIWEVNSNADLKGPISIFGTDINEVYVRARQMAEGAAMRRTLICTLDLPNRDAGPETLPFPDDFPLGQQIENGKSRAEEIVQWWQLPRSLIEERIPYIHGTRLYRYSGILNQIENAIKVLQARKDSSKALAVLIDPIRDFALQNGRGFSSFCLVQFRGRINKDGGKLLLDCLGYYRTQEFNHWWPINVAELRHMQIHVCDEVGMRPGFITTITADARTADAKSLTKVAVPLLDQWLDTNPTYIPLIADAIVHRSNGAASHAAKLWEQCLNDIWAGSEAYHDDGMPISIEGLEFLIACLAGKRNSDAISEGVREKLEHVLDANRLFNAQKQALLAYMPWKEKTRKLIEALRISTLSG